MFIGYGNLAAAGGAVGVVVEHHMHSFDDASAAVAQIEVSIERARGLPGVDADRVALWFFSGASLLTSAWLRDPPQWLSCLALTYPMLGAAPEWGLDPQFDPVDAVQHAGRLPVVLTRVGLERSEIAVGVEAFIAKAQAAGVALHVIDVAHGHHGFDMLDHTDESRVAVREAMQAVVAALG